MDQLPSFGKAIAQIVQPTGALYGSILQSKAAEIKSTPNKTFTYGSDPRQQLDVYYPSSNPSGSGCPILIFLYGGGLVRGAKIIPTVPNGLVYANLGHFFADKCGFVTVVADYRLVPQARFPSGGEDLALVVEWVRSNLKVLGGSEGEQKDLFIMGNSAGGIHTSTFLFHSAFAESRKHVLGQTDGDALRLRGAILLSVPFHFEQSDAGRKDVLGAYYGDRITEDCPMGLLKSVKNAQSVAEALPGVKIMVLTGSLDPEDEIMVPNRDFLKVWHDSYAEDAQNLQVVVMDGHNHISPPLALSTGDPREEDWGFQVAAFCNSARES